jgi:hypothetical protein
MAAPKSRSIEIDSQQRRRLIIGLPVLEKFGAFVPSLMNSKIQH